MSRQFLCARLCTSHTTCLHDAFLRACLSAMPRVLSERAVQDTSFPDARTSSLRARLYRPLHPLAGRRAMHNDKLEKMHPNNKPRGNIVLQVRAYRVSL